MLKIITSIYYKLKFKKAIKIVFSQAEDFVISDYEIQNEPEIKLQKYLKYCEVIWTYLEKQSFMVTYYDMDDKWLDENMSNLIEMVQAHEGN